MLKYGIIDAIITEPPLEDRHDLATTLASLSAMLTRATTELASTAIDVLQQELQDKIARCGTHC